MSKSHKEMLATLGEEKASLPPKKRVKRETEDHTTAMLREITLKVLELARSFKQIKFQQLIEQRQRKGFNHFIFDLKDSAHNTSGCGWALTNGTLHIEFDHFNHPQTQTEVHALLDAKLAYKVLPNGEKERNTWYELTDPSVTSSNRGFSLPIKTLGKYGENAAVDPILLIQNSDGSVSVLSGQRPVSNEYCLPGGMNETGVIQTCINELLEECFSGALFTPGSKSATTLNNRMEISKPALLRDIVNLCPAGILPPFSISSISASEIVENAIKIVVNSRLDEGQKAPLIAKIRCEIYKKYLPQQYNAFCLFVNDHMIKTFDALENTSDPRNTDAAYMVTKPLPGFIKNAELNMLTTQCSLDLGAGDDIGNVKFRSIDVFCGNILSTGTAPTDQTQGSYSAHASMVLYSVAAGLSKGLLNYSEALQAQVNTITTQHMAVLAVPLTSEQAERTAEAVLPSDGMGL